MNKIFFPLSGRTHLTWVRTMWSRVAARRSFPEHGQTNGRLACRECLGQVHARYVSHRPTTHPTDITLHNTTPSPHLRHKCPSDASLSVDDPGGALNVRKLPKQRPQSLTRRDATRFSRERLLDVGGERRGYSAPHRQTTRQSPVRHPCVISVQQPVHCLDEPLRLLVKWVRARKRVGYLTPRVAKNLHGPETKILCKLALVKEATLVRGPRPDPRAIRVAAEHVDHQGVSPSSHRYRCPGQPVVLEDASPSISRAHGSKKRFQRCYDNLVRCGKVQHRRRFVNGDIYNSGASGKARHSLGRTKTRRGPKPRSDFRAWMGNTASCRLQRWTSTTLAGRPPAIA